MPSNTGRVGGASIKVWLARNDATVLVPDASPRDAWHRYLQKITATTGTVSDLEKIWLRTRIIALASTVTGETLPDLWDRYLSVKGYSGNIGDKMRVWLDSGTP